jgi:hypothetical protein
MRIPDGAEKSVVEMVFIYKVGGVDKEFTEKIDGNSEGAVFVDRKDKVITEGYVPPIHDFTMEKDGSDFKENFLRLKVLLITAYDLAHADQNGMAKLEQLNKDATAKGYKVVGMTASSPEEIAAAKNNSD